MNHFVLGWRAYGVPVGAGEQSLSCSRCYAPAVVIVKKRPFCGRCAVESQADQIERAKRREEPPKDREASSGPPPHER